MKKIKWIILILFILGNVMVYNHAYQFTHFTAGEGIRKKPENLNLSEKIKILFCGAQIPKRRNKVLPKQGFETIYIQSHEKLEGWFIEQSNPKGVVILFHGYSGSKSGILNYGNAFNELGYSTLLMDFMGSGGSEGYQTTIGFKESQDVEVAYDYVKERFPNQKIILFGSSMGAVAIMKSIHDVLIDPSTIILECPFGKMRTTVQKRFDVMNLPSFPFADLLLFYGSLQNGFNTFKHNPIEYAKSINTPTLLLHGAKDDRVTMQEIETIYNNLKGEKELIILEESAHENYLRHSKTDWKEAVSIFLK